MNKRLMHAVMIAMTYAPMLASDKQTSEFESKQRSAALNALAGDDKPLTEKETRELLAAQNILFRLKTKQGSGMSAGRGLLPCLADHVYDLSGSCVERARVLKPCGESAERITCALSPDSKCLVVRNADVNEKTNIKILTDDRQVAEVDCSHFLGDIRFTDDGQFFLYQNDDKCVLANIHGGTVKFPGSVNVFHTKFSRFFNNNKNIIVATKNEDQFQVQLWDCNVNKCIQSYNNSLSLTEWSNLDVTADGTAVVTGAVTYGDKESESAVQIWDASTLQLSATKRLPNVVVKGPHCLTHKPQQCVIAYSGNIQFFDMRNMAVLPDSLAHTGVVLMAHLMAHAPKTDFIVSKACLERTVKLWDVHQKKCLATHTVGDLDLLSPVSISADGSTIAMCSGNKGEVQMLTYADSKKTLREAHKAAVLKTVKQDKSDADDRKE